MAHVLVILLNQVHLLIPLLSDPFGYGWNLLGTSDYRLNLNIMGPIFYWIVSVLSIVVGHVIEVVVSHKIAMKMIPNKSQALRTQYPMLVLMILYAMASLLIITQPMYISTA